MARGHVLLGVPRSVEEICRVLSCGLTPVQRARLVDVTRSRAAIAVAPSADDLCATLGREVDSADLVAIGPQCGAQDLARLVARVRSERPRVPVVVYLSAASHDASTIPSLAQAGAHEIIIPGYNDEGARLLAAVAAARRGCTERWVLARLGAVTPPRLMRFVEAVISEPNEVETVPALAERVGVHRKTLYNWCEMTRFFPPRELLLWCRLALAAHYLGATRCSVDTIARDVGFPSPTAFRNTLKRYAGLTATEVRAAGGLDCVIEIMARDLTVLRAGQR